ncbi:UNKNOWN [Stylonychia lemnae]|uniref:Uncharacterized protein n=1 Tax=Stylonychia lemnae TaxID=5949 RepID=A0A078BAF3_STYLE|nr:UNKNOWN [Stylonychia lemnae]|eukprot:CDW90237.1 UNKNOWN [Stylonychia lemnae]
MNQKQLTSIDYQGQLTIYDCQRFKLQDKIKISDLPLKQVIIDEFHERLIVSGYMSTIYSIDMNTLKVIAEFQPKHEEPCKKIYPCIKKLDFNSILVGTGNENLRKIDTLHQGRGLLFSYDLRDNQVNTKFRGHFDYILDLEVINEKYFVSSNHIDKMKVIDQNLLVWDIRNIIKGGHITRQVSIGMDIGDYKNCNAIYSGSQDGKLYIYDLKQYKLKQAVDLFEFDMLVDVDFNIHNGQIACLSSKHKQYENNISILNPNLF